MRALVVISLFALLTQVGCKSLATSALANALSGSSSVYASDEDPELVAAAIPFGLKTMEGTLVEQPEHVGLLTALASGFTQYGYGFVEAEAERIADDDYERAQDIRQRARKLYVRAKGYGLRGLEAEHPGFGAALLADAPAAMAVLEADDVPLIYWTAAAWGLSIGASSLEPAAIADFPVVVLLAKRALALDPEWGRGTIHELLLSLEASSPGGSLSAARAHFEAARALSEGQRAGTFVSMAGSVCVKEQNSREFHALLDVALSIDVNSQPELRLANVLMQRRARRLKASSEDLFLDDVGTSTLSQEGLRP